MSFVHLHAHTSFSMLDSTVKIPQLFKKAEENGMPAVAITDHGNMHGVLEFIKESKNYKVKPIVGFEAYFTPDRFKKDKEAPMWHLVLLAKNQEGYLNLLKLTSFANMEGFYSKPRVDRELLRKYRKGLIVLSACCQGEIAEDILAGGSGDIQTEWYYDLFKEDFYLEIQKHGANNEFLLKQNTVNEGLEKLSTIRGIPLVGTCDVHCLNKDDGLKRAILKAISFGETYDQAKAKYGEDVLWMKTPAEIKEVFKTPREVEACKNTLKIAEKVEGYDLGIGKVFMPQWKSPDKESTDDHFRIRAYQGLEKAFRSLYGKGKECIPKEYWERLDFELESIIRMKFPGYFMILADIMEWIDGQGIARGPARGSAAGSLVALALGITKVDPIKYGLYFERFLNPGRVSPPDIDSDFDNRYKDTMLRYFREKFGDGHVAQIGTFTKFKAKSAMRDVCRILGYDRLAEDRVMRLVPEEKRGGQGDNAITFEKVLALLEVQNAMSADIRVREAFEAGRILEGLYRQMSAHACGVVISDEPIYTHVPLSRVGEAPLPATQWDGKGIETVGLIKFDFLSLKNVAVIQEAINLLDKRYGVKHDISGLTDGDPQVFQMIAEGKNFGLFQIGEGGISEYSAAFKPKSIEDLSIIAAIYRPGPMDNNWHKDLLEIRAGRKNPEYPIPQIKEILEPTAGIMVYQEQVLAVARKMAGFSLSDADLLRKAIGKKLPKEMEKQRERFIQGCIANKYPEKVATDMFVSIERFSDYCFVKSHAVSYAIIAYQTAWLKAHHPVEFFTAGMALEDDTNELSAWYNACKEQGIQVLSPHINHSSFNFTPAGEAAIRFGLNKIKGISEESIKLIVKERETNGPFKDLPDFLERAGTCNAKCLRVLVDAGALDGLSLEGIALNRAQLRFLTEEKKSLQSITPTKQMDLFAKKTKIFVPDISNDIVKDLILERQVVGFYLTNHPLDRFTNVGSPTSIRDLTDKTTKILGVIVNIKPLTTKKDGKKFVSIIIEDKAKQIEALVFPKVYERVAHKIVMDTVVQCTGRVLHRQGRTTFNVSAVTTIEDIESQTCSSVIIRDPDSKVMEKIQSISNYFGHSADGVSLILAIKGVELEIGKFTELMIAKKALQMVGLKAEWHYNKGQRDGQDEIEEEA